MNLRLRLAFIYGLLASLALTLALVGGFGFYERAAFRNLDGTLALLTEHRAEDFLRFGILEPPKLAVPTTLRLFDAGGNLLQSAGDENAPIIEPRATLTSGVPAHYPWISYLPRVTPAPLSYEGLGLTRFEGKRWRSYTLTLENDRLLQLVISIEATDRVLSLVRRNFVILGLLGVTLVLLAGYALSGTSLRPLSELASSTKDLLHFQNIALPTTLAGTTRGSVESQRSIPSRDELAFLSDTITNTTTVLGEERERLDLALQAAHMGWWEWDAVHNIHRWSPEFERLLGLNPGEFTGGTEAFLERVHPNDRERVKALIAQTDTARATMFEYRVTDGTERWIESRAQTLRDAGGRIVRVLGIDADISERKRAQEQLRYAANVLASVSEAIIATDLEGRVQSWNKGAEDTYGYAPSEALGRSVTELLKTEFNGETQQSSREQLARTGRWRGEVLQYHKQGHPLEISSSVRFQRDEAGERVGMVAANRDITQRKAAERALQRSETFNRTVLESSPDCVKVLDPQGKIIFTNENGLCLLEFTSFDEVRGCDWWTLWPEEQRAHLKTLVEKALSGETSHYRGFAPTNKGTPKWWDVIISPIIVSPTTAPSVAANRDEVTQVLVVSRDITEAQQLEAEVRSNEERYRSLVQASAQLVWSTGADGFNATPQQSWLAFTGTTWEQEQGWGWLNAIHEDDRERVRNSWTRAVETKTMYSERERLRRYDGVYRHMDVRAVPVLNSDGSVREWVGTHTDVTERVNAAEALTESEERYRTLVMASNQAVFTSGDAGHLTGAEAVWHSLTGQAPDEAKGEGWLATVHDNDRARVQAVWHDAVAGRRAYEFSFQSNARGDKRRHVSVKAVPRFSVKGEFLEWIGAITDITERKQLELDHQFLADLSEMLRSAKDAEKLLPTISKTICQYLELPDCFFTELDEPHERYKVHAGYYSNASFAAREEPLSLYNPVTLREGKAGQVTVATNTATDERFVGWYEKHFKPTKLEAFTNVPFLRNGQLVGSFTVASDTPYDWTERELSLIQTVTERTWLTLEKLRVEQELEDQEKRYRTLVTATNQIVWTQSSTGQPGNEQLIWWTNLTGQSPDVAAGWGFLEAVHPEDRERTKHAWETSLAKLEPYDISYRVLSKDNEVHYLAVRGVPRFDDKGELLEWIGTMNDISERKRDEMLLAEQARTLRNQADLLALANEAIIIRNPESVITFWNDAATGLYGYTEGEAVGRRTQELFRTRFVSSSQDNVREALLAEGYWEGELQHVRKDGEKMSVLSRQAMRRDEDGKPLEIIEINWDITSRKQVEMQREKLLELTQRSEREALALAEIASSFSLAKPFETNLTMIAQRVAQTVGADACAIEIYTSDKANLALTGAYGYPDGFAEALDDIRRNKVEMIAQRAIRQREVVIMKDFIKTVSVNPRYAPVHELVKGESWGTVVAVPLPLAQYAGGAVVVFYPQGLDPNLTDLLQLSTIVSQVALVVENARLFEEAQGKAALEERQRLARDLHDSVSQALYGISLGANSAKTALSIDSSEAKLKELERSLDYLIYMGDTAMAEMKSLIFELRPESLATEGLVVALRKHLRALELRHRFGLTLDLLSEPNVSLKVKEMLYRITQEAMNNVVKHAQAKNVWIRLEEQEEVLELTVRDDGLGFDTTKDFPGHLGLRSMRERAESVGARYEVSSEKGQGTIVRVVIPTL